MAQQMHQWGGWERIASLKGLLYSLAGPTSTRYQVYTRASIVYKVPGARYQVPGTKVLSL